MSCSMRHSSIEDQRRRSSASVKLIIAAMALAAVAMAVGVRVMADALGMGDELARIVATALLACAVADLVVLQVWDRIYPPVSRTR